MAKKTERLRCVRCGETTFGPDRHSVYLPCTCPGCKHIWHSCPIHGIRINGLPKGKVTKCVCDDVRRAE